MKKSPAKKAKSKKGAVPSKSTTKATARGGVVTKKASAQAGAVAKKASAKKGAVAKTAPPKAGAVAKKASAKTGAVTKKASAETAPPKAGAVAKKASAKTGAMARRADYGAPIDQFFAKQTGELREVVDALRGLVEAAAPDASASLKWGMPFYTVAGEMYCAIGGHKAHVNLILPGAPGTFKDPRGLLAGEGKTGQHLKLRSREDLPDKLVREWLKLAADNARAKAT